MEQMHLFDYIRKPFKIDKPIRLIELFGGIGSQAMALRNIGADFEHHLLVEFDPAPVKSYNAIHGTNFVPMPMIQITTIDSFLVLAISYQHSQKFLVIVLRIPGHHLQH